MIVFYKYYLTQYYVSLKLLVYVATESFRVHSTIGGHRGGHGVNNLLIWIFPLLLLPIFFPFDNSNFI